MRNSSTLWLILAAALLGATTLGYPWTLLDSPISTYIGQVILDGGLPYRDAWDARAPGVFFAYALQILLFGKNAIGLRVFDVLWQLATALVLASIAVRIAQRRSAGLLAGIAYLLIYFSQNFWNWAQPDTFLSLPLALSFLFLVRGLASLRAFDWFVAALFVGAGTLFKLPYGLFGVILLFASLRSSWPDAHRVGSHWLALATGFATPLIVTAAYFAAKGGLQDLISAQFVFAPAYVARIHSEVGFREFHNSLLRPVMAPLYLMAGLGFGVFIRRCWSNSKPSPSERFLPAWLGVPVVAFFLHGSYLGYHYAPFFAPTVTLFACGVSEFLSEYRTHRSPRQLYVLLLALLSLAAPLEKFRQHCAFTWRNLQGRAAEAPLRKLGEYIRSGTSPRDTIFVWGNAAVVYLYADRKAASRFLCTAYLSIEAGQTNYPVALLTELEANNPKYFLLFLEGPVTPALPDSPTSYRQFPALRERIEKEYMLEKETAAYQLYRRNH